MSYPVNREMYAKGHFMVHSMNCRQCCVLSVEVVYYTIHRRQFTQKPINFPLTAQVRSKYCSITDFVRNYLNSKDPYML